VLKGHVTTASVPDGLRGSQSSAPPLSVRRRSTPDGNLRILLVDGGEDALSRLTRSAAAHAAVVHQAKDAGEAVAYALKFTYDVVIVDAEPSSQGTLGLMDQLAALQRTAAMLMSIRGSDKSLPELPSGSRLSGSLLGVLKKPWSEEELTYTLDRAIGFSAARLVHESERRAGVADAYRVLFLGSAPEFDSVTRLVGAHLTQPSLVRLGSLEEAVVLLGSQSFDVTVTTPSLVDAYGLDPVLRLRRLNAHTPIIVLAPTDDPAFAAQALQAGAQDVLVRDGVDGPGFVRAIRHAVQRQRAQAQLHHGALHDELTGLAKRSVLYQRIENALARCRRMGNTFAVMYIDLDRFKSINDTYGHDVGDAVLVAVSHRLTAAVREYDTVARLGGDEFAILLDTLDEPDEAVTVAQRVLALLARPIRVSCRSLDVTASMGISVFPHGGGELDELIRSADQAMYHAKRSGRNTYSLAPRPAEAPVSEEARAIGAALRRSASA
jgi:diguanylate cyclase (GGDEF)-like protein